MSRLHRLAASELLATSGPTLGVSQPGDLADLPAPARRFLTSSLTPGIGLTPTVELDMVGEIRLRRWVPFRARQVLRVGEGFVWDAVVGKGPLRFSGGDALWRGSGDLDFRLWGILPVAHAEGPDIARSAAGRLAAETVAWAPQGLTPQMGATWTAIDSDRATAALDVGQHSFEVSVGVDSQGHLRDLVMSRWGNPNSDHFEELPFGGSFDDHGEFAGITIATAGRVGWHWGTEGQDEGEFFRYNITDARFRTAHNR